MQTSAIEHSQTVSRVLVENASLYLSTIDDPSQTQESLMNKAVSLFNLFRYKECVSAAKRVLKGDKNSVDGWLLLAQAHRKLNEFEQSNEALDKYLKLRPEDSQAHYNKALNFDDLGQWERADLALQKALKIRRQFPEALFKRGSILSLLNLKREALTELSAAIRLEPHNPDYHFARGVVEFEVLQFEEALRDFEKCLSVSESFGEAIVWKCTVLDKLERTEEAIEFLSQKIDGSVPLESQSAPKDTDSALSYDSQKTPKASPQITDDALTDLCALRVRYSVQLMRYQRAIRLVETDLILRLKAREGWFYFAVLSREVGDKETALSAVTKAISGDQNNAVYYCFRGALFVSSEKQKALNDFQRAAQITTQRYPNMYLRSEQQTLLHNLFVPPLEPLIPRFISIVGSLSLFDQCLDSADPKFARHASVYRDIANRSSTLFDSLFKLGFSESTTSKLGDELAAIEQELLELNRHFSVIRSLEDGRQPPESLESFWASAKSKEPLLFRYVELFYGTLIAYFHNLGVMSGEPYEIVSEGQTIIFPKFQESSKVSAFELLANLMFEASQIGRKFGAKNGFETVFESRLSDKKSHKLRLFLFETALKVALNGPKRKAIAADKLSDCQEAFWEAFRGQMKRIGKYDKLRKFVDSYSDKLAFLDSFYTVCYVNRNPGEFADGSMGLSDQIACVTLTDGHLRSGASRGQKGSKLEGILGGL